VGPAGAHPCVRPKSGQTRRSAPANVSWNRIRITRKMAVQMPKMTGRTPVPPNMGLLRRSTPRNDKLEYGYNWTVKPCRQKP
jgi:hypothetical protein